MKKNEALYNLIENNEGEILHLMTGTKKEIIEKLDNKVEIGDETYILDLDENMTIEEINAEIDQTVGISWYSLKIEESMEEQEMTKESYLVEEYHVNNLVMTYTIEKSYDEVVEDLKAIKRILPWASKASITYHVGTGKENKITELLTVI